MARVCRLELPTLAARPCRSERGRPRWLSWPRACSSLDRAGRDPWHACADWNCRPLRHAHADQSAGDRVGSRGRELVVHLIVPVGIHGTRVQTGIADPCGTPMPIRARATALALVAESL